MSSPSLYPIDAESDDRFKLSTCQNVELETKLQYARDHVIAAQYSQTKDDAKHIREATLHLIRAAAILGYDLVRKA